MERSKKNFQFQRERQIYAQENFGHSLFDRYSINIIRETQPGQPGSKIHTLINYFPFVSNFVIAIFRDC